MKVCNCCRAEKPLLDYHRNKKANDGLCATCKDCAKARAKAWHAANPDRSKATKRAIYERNKPEYVEKAKAWADANRERRREIVNAYDARNKEAKSARMARRFERRKLEDIDGLRAQIRAAAAIRRTRVLAGVVEKVDFAAIMERDGMICYLCRHRVARGDLHFDHVIPICRGGGHTADNLRVTHAKCNMSKGSKLLEELSF